MIWAVHMYDVANISTSLLSTQKPGNFWAVQALSSALWRQPKTTTPALIEIFRFPKFPNSNQNLLPIWLNLLLKLFWLCRLWKDVQLPMHSNHRLFGENTSVWAAHCQTHREMSEWAIATPTSIIWRVPIFCPKMTFPNGRNKRSSRVEKNLFPSPLGCK